MAHTCSTSLICCYSTANWFPPLVGSLYTKLVFEPPKNPPKNDSLVPTHPGSSCDVTGSGMVGLVRLSPLSLARLRPATTGDQR